ncbi:MAG: S26 family signal peptidase [Clostridiales bacterium]|nr:MAG: S26 family signal peptidase [Clostridiales bacterium]
MILFVIVLAFKCFLFIGYVPSESMEPTLKSGSYIIGSRIYGELKTGDIIIFEHDGKNACQTHSGNRRRVDHRKRIYFILSPMAVILSWVTIENHSFDSRYWTEPYVRENEIEAKMLY